MACFAVIRERGGPWDFSLTLREQEQWAEHAVFMEALVDEGFVVLGGPFADGLRVLLIVEAESEAQIEARLADDPWTPMGLLRTLSIDRWEILLRATKV